VAVYRDVRGEPVDDVVFVYYPDARSYTGEAMLEISSHGNPLIAGKILEDLFMRGCRSAEPGEFTRTAFMNGKLDLSQAEAVVDLIRARSDRALEVARKQLQGSVGRRVNSLIDNLLEIISEIEAYIDFPDEDLPAENVEGPVKALQRLSEDLVGLISTSHLSALVHDGVRTVIVGAPNAGKSSLLNALIGEDRVIVAEEPGTTRDFVEERVAVGPYMMRLIDTAGLHAASTEVEEKGIAKTYEQISKADILLLVVDAAAPTPLFPDAAMAKLSSHLAIMVENKIDLAHAVVCREFFPEVAHVRVSALTGEGVEKLRGVLLERLEADLAPVDAGEVILSARHADALREAKDALRAALDGLRAAAPAELVASELRAALDAFGRITGKVDNEAMLDRLFARFCIGK
jgi:tRNA modification GTPase